MRFICLHGVGTNNQVFEMQSAAIRHELGDHHTFEFVEGSIPKPPGPGIESLVSLKDDFFAYANDDSAQSIEAAIRELDTYVEAEGPFDGIMAFSQGAALAAMYLIRKQQQVDKDPTTPAPIRCAVFFCGEIPADPALIEKGEICEMDHATYGITIKVPTAHIWGANDDNTGFGRKLSEMCNPVAKSSFIHQGGHELPGPKSKDDVVKAVHTIRRVIAMAETS